MGLDTETDFPSSHSSIRSGIRNKDTISRASSLQSIQHIDKAASPFTNQDTPHNDNTLCCCMNSTNNTNRSGALDGILLVE